MTIKPCHKAVVSAKYTSVLLVTRYSHLENGRHLPFEQHLGGRRVSRDDQGRSKEQAALDSRT
jgi:hypothetical protein